MAEKTITAKIDVNGKTVTLKGDPGLAFPMNFDVKAGDTLNWTLENCPAGSTARVRFVESPGPPPLLEKGDTVNGSGQAILGGVVASTAPIGGYSYDFFLVTAKGEEKLRCVWTNGTHSMPTPGDRAPGKKSGGP